MTNETVNKTRKDNIYLMPTRKRVSFQFIWDQNNNQAKFIKSL